MRRLLNLLTFYKQPDLSIYSRTRLLIDITEKSKRKKLNKKKERNQDGSKKFFDPLCLRLHCLGRLGHDC